MNKLDLASVNALKNCIGLKRKDTLMIISDFTTKTIAESLMRQASKITKNILFFNLELFGRPITSIPLVIRKNIQNSTVIIFMAQSFDKELSGLRRPLRLKALTQKVRFIHMPKITEKIFIDTVGVDYKKIWALTKKLRTKLEKAKTIQVTSQKGTNLNITTNPKHKWVSSDGDFRIFNPERLNLPGAEVLTCPENVEGTLIVDGLLGGHFTEKYRSLIKNPLTLEIKKSRIFKATCKDRKLLADFVKYTKTDPEANRVGEIGFGTNIFIKKYYYNFLADEKIPGFHLAFGNPYPERTNANWKSKIHLDCLIRKASTTINEKETILKNNSYLL